MCSILSDLGINSTSGNRNPFNYSAPFPLPLPWPLPLLLNSKRDLHKFRVDVVDVLVNGCNCSLEDQVIVPSVLSHLNGESIVLC